MAKWKEISKLSGKDEKTREAAFEAAMMAELAKTASSQSPPTSPAPPPLVQPSGITIAVTENGQTTTYELDKAPLPLRKRIVDAWLSKPPPG